MFEIFSDEERIKKEAELEARDNMIDMILNVMADNGDKRAVLMQASRSFEKSLRECQDRAVNNEISNEKIDTCISLINQLQKLLNNEINN